ncbi:MAG: hypothetical protein LUC93_06305 [Planctomycetaceae bacterium]|nr:hypothetical protein [Planctomycetaceae bacterium]
MRYTILHEVPGRMRVHCRTLRLGPENRIELNRWVSQHAELASATLSTRTGNLLVVYARDVDRRVILILLDELRLFEGASIGNPDNDAWSFSEATINVALGEVIRTAIKAALPKPLDKAVTGFKIGRSCITVGAAVAEHDLLGGLYALGKFVLFSFFATSLPARFLLHLAASFVNHLLAHRQPPLLKYVPEAAAAPVYAPAYAAM